LKARSDSVPVGPVDVRAVADVRSSLGGAPRKHELEQVQIADEALEVTVPVPPRGPALGASKLRLVLHDEVHRRSLMERLGARSLPMR
jgi:hypothetical protein